MITLKCLFIQFNPKFWLFLHDIQPYSIYSNINFWEDWVWMFMPKLYIFKIILNLNHFYKIQICFIFIEFCFNLLSIEKSIPFCFFEYFIFAFLMLSSLFELHSRIYSNQIEIYILFIQKIFIVCVLGM